MAYSEVGDLLLGDLIIAESVDRQKFVDLAAREINSKLGWIYELPLHPAGTDPVTDTSWTSLPAHEADTLRDINNRLASGRLILSLAIGGEEVQLHALGWHYVNSALEDLMVIANGTVDLTAVRIGADSSSFRDIAPSISQYDDESLLLGFEQGVMKSNPWYTEPGKIH